MRIAIIGASGFIGSALTLELLANTNHTLVLFSHRATKLTFTPKQERSLTHIDGSVLNKADIKKALQGCDMVVYLVHLMGEKQHKGSFIDAERQAATNFAKAVADQNIKRVIYVGGMAKETDGRTQHLKSRQQTGEIIRSRVKQLIELRTPMVIGDGGAGYEVLKSIVKHSPIFPLPTWAQATTQPITVNDVVRYIVASMNLPTKKHLSVAIGGPEQLSYQQIAKKISQQRGKKLLVVQLPFVPKKLAIAGLKIIAPKQYANTVADMIASAGHSTPPIGQEARKVFPNVLPEIIDTAL